MEEKLTSLKTEVVDDAGESFVVEYDILPAEDISVSNPLRNELNAEIANVDNQLDALHAKLDSLNSEIDRLTNHADGIDYAVAVASGVLCGMIDIFFVGKWDFEHAKAVSNKKVNEKVIAFVKKDPRYIPWCSDTIHGRKARDPDRLDSAIEFLEEHYHLPGDGAYKSGQYGVYGRTHRLDDFCHHPTLIGLICCIVVQFTGSTVYCTSESEIVNIPIQVNQYGKFVGKTPIGKLFSGIINWFFAVAETLANRKGHLMSDMATSAGIPGPFLSLLKELSALPCFKGTGFGESLRKAFQNGIGSGKSQLDLGVFNELFSGASSKFDKRTEMAITHELKRQSIPVILNEVLVRGAYFIRRFIKEVKEKSGIANINWKNVIPFNNRTIARMMTIASGTFTAIDMADAAIHGAAESGGTPAGFAKGFIVRVNFVGIGRFAVAVGTDVGMGIKREKLRNERMKVMGEQLALLNVKLYYQNAVLFIEEEEMFRSQKQMWIAAKSTVETLDMAYKATEESMMIVVGCLKELSDDLEKISSYRVGIEEHNPGLTNEMSEILKYGGIHNG